MSKRREVDLGQRLLREAREELVRADGKASLLLAAASVIAVAVLAAILAGAWQPFYLGALMQIAWWLGAAAGVAAIVALAIAVYPITSYRRARSAGVVAYFGDIVGLTSDELRARLVVSAERGLAIEDQLLVISGIVDRKYRSIQIAIWLFAVSSVLCIASVLINRFWP